MITILVVALAVRLPLIPFESGDYQVFLSRWYDEIQSGGGFRALQNPISNYTPPYIYLLTGLTYLPVPKLAAIKLLSITFDFGMAAALQRLIRSAASSEVATRGLVIALFLPTVWLNSALWGQSDALYTAFLIFTVAMVIRRRPAVAMGTYGLALAIKLQAAFLLPLFLVLLLRGRMRWWLLLVPPTVYLIVILPAAVIGRPLSELLTIYLGQAQDSDDLTRNAPTLYQWLPNNPALVIPGIILAMSASLILVVEHSRRRVPLDSRGIMTLALAILILVPFTLPKMHERYFYPADVVALAYACSVPQRWRIPVLMVSASTLSYLPFLFGAPPVILPVASLIVALALVAVVRDLFSRRSDITPGFVAAPSDGGS